MCVQIPGLWFVPLGLHSIYYVVALSVYEDLELSCFIQHIPDTHTQPSILGIQLFALLLSLILLVFFFANSIPLKIVNKVITTAKQGYRGGFVM